jgi:hypothetical protein
VGERLPEVPGVLFIGKGRGERGARPGNDGGVEEQYWRRRWARWEREDVPRGRARAKGQA